MKTTTEHQAESTYVTEAKKVLQGMNIKYSAKFIGNGKHFADDNAKRDRFNCTFSRNGKIFSIKFGQSLKDSTGNGSHIPTEYDLLACITKNDPESFEDFCSEFGYDKDSRTDERIYKAVCKEWDKVNKFFTDAEIEKLQEIQ